MLDSDVWRWFEAGMNISYLLDLEGVARFGVERVSKRARCVGRDLRWMMTTGG